MHGDYECGIISKAKFDEFQRRAVHSELAQKARGGQPSRLMRVWHSLQVLANTLKPSRPSERQPDWTTPAEASLEK